MKKAITLLVAAIMLVSFCAFTTSAEGAINANERAILDKISAAVPANGKTFTIPAKVLNQAKNYFLSNDINGQQSKKVISFIDRGREIVRQELLSDTTSKSGTVNMSIFSNAAKQQILSLGQQAAAVANLTLTYTPSTNLVRIIKNSDNSVVFENTAAIKVTGSNITTTIAVTVATIVILGFGAAIFAAKKFVINR